MAALPRFDLKFYQDWSPQSETNCATTALYASGVINDLMHVDPEDLSQFILPYCYEKTESKTNVLAVGFGTSKDQTDYRRLLHVFYIDKDGFAFNKAGGGFENKFEFGPRQKFEDTFKEYFLDMESLLSQSVTGEIEYYQSKNDSRCPLNDYESKLKKFIKSSEFFQSRLFVRTQMEKFDSDFEIKDSIARKSIISQLQKIDARIEILFENNSRIYKKVALNKGLPLELSKDFHEIYPLVNDPIDIENLQEYFYLSLARKQLRMLLGIDELADLPKH